MGSNADLLVYVRITVTAIFDFMTKEDYGE